MNSFTHLLAGALAMAASGSGFAQPYPSKPITIIVPFSVGTPQDILSRVAGKAMGDRMGISIIVDNRAGASGSIGNSMVGKAPPDGYTLLMTSTSFIISKALNPSFPYEPLKQYSPIALLATGDMGFFVSADTPAQSFGEVHVWYALLGPAGLPGPALSRLNAEINGAIAQADVRELFERQSLRLIGGRPDQLAALMKSETDRWNRVVKDAGIKAE
jgi:tripartite-type tricarboxylate transporter receptor subunit TctC